MPFKSALSYIKSRTKSIPSYGIILGTGLSQFVECIDIEVKIDYKSIPNFPTCTVGFHKGQLIFGKINGQCVVVMHGRLHYYEGYTIDEVVFPIRILKLLGVNQLFISNAAGGLHPDFVEGDLMLIKDHIHSLPNPLVGKNLDDFGMRFTDMYNAYDKNMRIKAKNWTKKNSFNIKEGVYFSISGPSLETSAEYKMIRALGADAVGMSTTPEVIVARHSEIKVIAVSVITDVAFEGNFKPINMEHIFASINKAEPLLVKLFCSMIK